ncbi:MAG: zinc dependent phospholipase C family protein [Nitrospirae bacterium]|nr:zinc dependent phospholipase C family protein [Nitrospirota bacterium]
MLFVSILLGFILAPSAAFAWGPMTHLYLGQTLLSASPSLISPVIFDIIRAYPRDFLYGSIIADIVVGKRFQEQNGDSHSWELPAAMLDLARNDAHRAFAYGYQAHLAADTVAHNEFIPRFILMPNITHALLEMKADSLIDRQHWIKPDSAVQMRNDILLERAMTRPRLRFSTNKRIFKGMLMLSRLNYGGVVGDFIDRHLPYIAEEDEIRHYMGKALSGMIDCFSAGEGASVMKSDPLGKRTRGRLEAYGGR